MICLFDSDREIKETKMDYRKNSNIAVEANALSVFTHTHV